VADDAIGRVVVRVALRREHHARVGGDRRCTDGVAELVLEREHVARGDRVGVGHLGRAEEQRQRDDREKSKHPRDAATHPVSVHVRMRTQVTGVR
jgi:hypothetical protein